MALQQKIGEKIRNLRKEKGWTQEIAAEKTKLSVTAYSKIERGQTDISLSRLESIAEAFETAADSLITACQTSNFIGNTLKGNASINQGKTTHKYPKDKAIQEILWSLNQIIEELKQRIEVLEGEKTAHKK